MIRSSSSVLACKCCALIVGLTFGAPVVLSQSTAGGTSVPSYKILSDGLFVVTAGKQITLAQDTGFILEDITPCLMADQSSPKYSCTDAEKSGKTNSLRVIYPLPDNVVKVSGVVVHFQYLVVSATGRLFLGGRLYRFTYWTSKADQSGKTVNSPNQVTIDTRPIITASVTPKFRGMTQIVLGSPIVFAQKGAHLEGSLTNCPGSFVSGVWEPVTLKYGGTGSGADLHGEVQTLNQDRSDHPNDPNNLVRSTALIGVAFVCISADLRDPFLPTLDAANNVIQAAVPAGSGPVTSPLIPGECTDQNDPSSCAEHISTIWAFAPGTKIVAQPDPTLAKTNAPFYANVNMVAATGSKFAWGLDGKLAELQRPLVGNSSITWLSATANVGNNTSSIKGQTYTDSIDWTLPISYDWRKVPLTFSFAPDYSTDIEFDRKNMLADIHITWITRYKRLAWNIAPESGADAKYSSINIKPGFGEQLYLQAGVESGGALIDTTQKASSGNAKIAVPAYNIARIVPQIHGVLEWKPIKNAGVGVFTFDDTFTGRYLLETENTVEQYVIPGTPPTVGLLLRPISGWKGYNSFVTNWYPPRSSNAAIGITFNDGFNAPKFSRVNSVTIGVTIMY
jgi:hypothetical protein